MRNHAGLPTQSGRMFLQVEVEDQFLYQHEHLIMGLTFALSKSVRADRSLKERSDRCCHLARQNLGNPGQFRIALRKSTSPVFSTGRRGGSAEHDERVSRGRTETRRAHSAARFRSAASPGIHRPHGQRPHLREPQIASLCGLSVSPSFPKSPLESPRRKMPAAGIVTP